MMNNILKKTMEKRPVFGMTVYTGSAPVIEALGNFGFDFAFIDAEHTPFAVTDLEKCVMAARLSGVSPLVRVTKPDEIEIRKVFEMGAEGVIIPHVKDKGEAEVCVRSSRFVPNGRRGFDSTVRSANYGGAGYTADEYIENSQTTELVIPMAEDYEFMDNIDEILSVKGIDAINFGPADFALSKNIRVFYKMDQPEIENALKIILEKTAPLNMPVMAPVIPPTMEKADVLIEKGVKMLIMGSDMYNFQSALGRIQSEAVEKIITRYK